MSSIVALTGAAWFKSSYSGSDQGQCVEVADLTTTRHAAIAVCDSKRPDGPALLLTPAAFSAFVNEAATGVFTA